MSSLWILARKPLIFRSLPKNLLKFNNMHTVLTDLNVSFKRNRGSRIVCDTIFLQFSLPSCVLASSWLFFIYIHNYVCLPQLLCFSRLFVYLFFSPRTFFLPNREYNGKDEARNRSNEADSVFRVYLFIYLLFFFKGIIVQIHISTAYRAARVLVSTPFFQYLSKITQWIFHWFSLGILWRKQKNDKIF